MARTFLYLLALAFLVAGVFGALHNQLSYSVGASYFHDIKFPQFGIADDMRNRLGAAWVGVQASWKVGLLIGLPVFGLGAVVLDRPELLRRAGISATVVAVLLTLGGAMFGLMLGLIAPSVADALPLPDGLGDRDSFLRAALMHEGAYYGAALGLPIGLWMVFGARRRARSENA